MKELLKPSYLCLALASLTACQSEKPTQDNSYLLPTGGFSSATSNTLEENAETLYLTIPITLPQGYKEDYLREGSEEDFALSGTVSVSETSSATESDYSLGQTSFTGGLDDPKFIVPVTIINDTEAENTELLVLNFSSVDVNQSTTLSATHTITIMDTDSPLSVNFTSKQSAAKEGDFIDVELALSTPYPASLDFPITVSGTATLSSDYLFGQPVYFESGVAYDATHTIDSNEDETNLVVRFPAGATVIHLPISVVNDGKPELSEYALLTVSDNEEAGYKTDTTPSFKLAILGEEKVNDTGINRFSDGSVTQALTSSSADYPHQDAGKGAILDNSTIQGFNLVRLDIDGNEINATDITDANSIRCTYDQSSGLTWINSAPMPDSNNNNISDTLEQTLTYQDPSNGATSISVNGHFRNPSNILIPESSNWLYVNFKYYYSSDDEDKNGGIAGNGNAKTLYTSSDISTATASSTPDSINNLATSQNCLPLYVGQSSTTSSQCTSEAVIEFLNSAGWCGNTDWRLPTIKELVTTASYKEGEHATAHFSNFGSNAKLMSSSTVPSSPGSMYCLTSDGQSKKCNKMTPTNIMPVSDSKDN